MAKIKGLSTHEQPREKLIEKGVENLRDSELMAVLLRTGMKGKNVVTLSREILRKYPKKKLLSLDFDTLSEIKGIGPAKACILLAGFELAKRSLEVFDDNLPFVQNIKDVVAQVQNIKDAKREHFVVLYLNARNQLIHKETISIGTLTASLVHPREVFYPAVEKFAVSIIVVHNHPSGNIEPSKEDLNLTRRLIDAGELLGIVVLDHIVVTHNKNQSILKKIT